MIVMMSSVTCTYVNIHVITSLWPKSRDRSCDSARETLTRETLHRCAVTKPVGGLLNRCAVTPVGDSLCGTMLCGS